jgi:hypothetical protein
MARQTEAGLVPDNAEKESAERSVSAFQRSIILPKNIVAMAVESLEDGTARHVSLTQLPTGTEVAILGESFNTELASTLQRSLVFCLYARYRGA